MLPVIETPRLLLRPFTEADLPALFRLLSDETVNTFLPWYPVKNPEEARRFWEARFLGERYAFAICLKTDAQPIGYIKAENGGAYDVGYALEKAFWNRGITSEAGAALLELLHAEQVPFVTATHDVRNSHSGGVMRKIGMRYCYSYVEQWQPKNIPVTFRLYQRNLDGNETRVYLQYWNRYPTHFRETNL